MVASAAALVAGLAAGFVAEVLSRLLLWPFLGRAIVEAPLLVRQFFDDSDHVAGLTGHPNQDARKSGSHFGRIGSRRSFPG